jgi:hypothetical protein
LQTDLETHRLEAKVGPLLDLSVAGTQRRKKKHVNQVNVNEDKKLKSAIKKFGTIIIVSLQI